MKKSITIIGAGGQMGQWFSKYFADKDFQVTGYDEENKIKGKDIIQAGSLVGAILKADYVILCTPTRKTPEIIRLIAKEMKRGTQFHLWLRCRQKLIPYVFTPCLGLE
jgi:prephenate dehydrogenase